MFVVTVLALVGLGRPALAHAVSNSDWTYTSPSNCTFNLSEISDGAGGGQFYTEVWSDLGTPVGCAVGNVRQAGELRLGYDLLRWDSSWGWTLCSFNGWYHNAVPGVSLTLDSGSYAFAPCGDGWYGVSGLGYAQVNGLWRGGSMWSWEHCFGSACGSLAAAASTAESDTSGPKPPRPEWVDENGKVDFDRMPEELPRVNAEGDVTGKGRLKRGPESHVQSEPLMPSAPRSQR